jgi:hypothetical protein
MAIALRSISPQSEQFDFGLWLSLVERVVWDKYYTHSFAEALPG